MGGTRGAEQMKTIGEFKKETYKLLDVARGVLEVAQCNHDMVEINKKPNFTRYLCKKCRIIMWVPDSSELKE